MAQPFKSPPHWPRLSKVVECFLLSGCLLGYGPEIFGDHDTYRLRYLYNPETDRYANLGRLEDDEQITPDEVESWERALECVIPKPWGA